MFNKILLPVDLSDKHQRACDIALELAKPNGAIALLHVVELIAGLSMEEEKNFYARLEKLARRHLEHLGEGLKDRQVSWKPEVLYGNRGPEVVRYAAAQKADLIILTCPHSTPTTWESAGRA